MRFLTFKRDFKVRRLAHISHTARVKAAWKQCTCNMRLYRKMCQKKLHL